MPIEEMKLQEILRKEFPTGEIICKDLAGDNDHWEVTIIDQKFSGLSKIKQHKMVQNAVLDFDIHALSIKTKVSK